MLRTDRLTFAAIVAPALALITWAASTQVTATPPDEPPAPDSQKNPPRLSTPDEALRQIRMPEGFHASLFASEPEVRQPISITTDPRGRLWIAENYTYAEAPLSFDETLRDRILVFDDTNRDGRSDRRTVFHDNLKQLTSVEVGFGGVWALCPPQLLFLPDANGDDRPDADPVVVLDGFDVGAANRHNFANGLRWGPDGWLYGRNGISNPGRVGAPGTPEDRRTHVGPGIWRYHPVTRAFEMVSTGTTNPWGHDWDRHGQLFFINTVIGHLWHALPGSHLERMFGADANPYVYELMGQTADHVHWDSANEEWTKTRQVLSASTDQAGGGHAHSGFLIYQGDNWPADYRDKLFTVNLHGHRLNRDRFERQGAGYVGKHEADTIFFGDPWFRGIDLVTGPEGSVYLIDWTDVGECHENDGVHRSSGRVFRLSYGDVTPPPAELHDLSKLDSVALAALMTHTNDWYPRQARRLIQERAARGVDQSAAVDALRAQLTGSDSDVVRLRALWSLNAAGAVDEALLLSLLGHADEHLRTWAIRLLVDHGAPSPAARQAMIARAKSDPSGLVLLYLASALQKIAPADRWELASALASRSEFATDRVFPLLVWYGVEGAVPAHPDQASRLAASAALPTVRRLVARRLTQQIAQRPGDVDRLVQALAGVSDPVAQLDVLQGMAQALRGVRKAAPPSSWSETQSRLLNTADDPTKALVRELGLVFGDGRALDDLTRLVADRKGDLDQRRSAVRSLVTARAEGLEPLLTGLLTDRDLAPEVVRGLATIDRREVAKTLVESFGRLDPFGRAEVVAALAGRPRDAGLLLDAVASNQIPRAYVPVALVRQIQRYDDPALSERLATLWPELKPITAEKASRIARIKETLSESALSAADPKAGRRLWQKSCTQCHTLFGEGGKIGPDLTGSQRGNLDYVLENVIDPSASLAPAFRATTLALSDGRVLNAVVLSKTDSAWEVQTTEERLSIPVADIEEAKETNQSLMPEGLLDLLSPTEVRDLISYLMSPTQVPLD